jgi:UrcA family protein
VVQYSDLDLKSIAGNKVLYARLAAAAERACGYDLHSRDLQRRMQYRACYDSALNRAVDKIGSRELQVLHATDDAHNVG